MMRELKFRVWNEREKTYDDGWDYLLSSDGGLYALKYGALVGMSGVDYLTVEFDTGLKDKNGKEIYDGDIVQDSKGEKCFIRWNKSEAHFGLYMSQQIELTDFIWMRGEDLEVIGNIHENKELLEA